MIFSMKYAACLGMVTSVLMMTSLSVQASEPGWYVRSYAGFSELSDLDADSVGFENFNGRAEIETDSGFNAGINLGYRYNRHWSAELGWEYRSNDTETTLANGSRFTDGDYASNSFALNGLYHFDAPGAWQPYVGAGITWLQEIDLDVESNGQERSFSSDGDVGYQVFAGIDYQLSNQWSINTELRYGSTTDIDLKSESNSGNSRFNNLDYEPTTVQFGLKYTF